MLNSYKDVGIIGKPENYIIFIRANYYRMMVGIIRRS